MKIPVTALESSGFDCLGLSLDLRVTETEGRIEVEILKEDSLSFCGLFLVLKYDSSLQLCLAEMGESFDDLELSFEQGEDSVCFLIDGIDNAEGCGTIVRFIFKLSPESGIDHINSCFGLYRASSVSAYYIRNGSILPRDVYIKRQMPEESLKKSCSVSVFSVNDDSARVSIDVFSSKSFFAYGAEIRTVNLSDKKEEVFYVAGIHNGGDSHFDIELSIPKGGCCCIMITPFSMTRTNTEDIESRVYVVVNGVLFD